MWGVCVSVRVCVRGCVEHLPGVCVCVCNTQHVYACACVTLTQRVCAHACVTLAQRTCVCNTCPGRVCVTPSVCVHLRVQHSPSVCACVCDTPPACVTLPGSRGPAFLRTRQLHQGPQSCSLLLCQCPRQLLTRRRSPADASRNFQQSKQQASP